MFFVKSSYIYSGIPFLYVQDFLFFAQKEIIAKIYKKVLKNEFGCGIICMKFLLVSLYPSVSVRMKELYTVEKASLSPAVLYEKLEQTYRLLSTKVSSRSIGSGQGRYLQLLLSGDGISQTELVPLLGVSPSTASELTDKLLAAGHITRAKDASDKRRVLIYITDSGKEVADSFKSESAAAVQEAFSLLSAEEQATLYSLLSALTDGEKIAVGAPVCEDKMIRPGKRL